MSRRTKKEKFPADWAEISARIRATNERSPFDAPQIVGRKLFGDGRIDVLSARDTKLIHDYIEIEPLLFEQPPAYSLRYPVDRWRIGSAKPVPAALRNSLDRAIGRYLRMHAQRITVAEWLKRCPGAHDRKALLKALADIDAPVVMPTAGKRPRLEQRIERAIDDACKTGELTEAKLADMLLKDFGERFGCSITTASKLKKSNLERLRKLAKKEKERNK